MERLARSRARAQRHEFSRSLCVTRFGATLGTLCNESHLVPAARAGDRWALDLIRQATRPLGRVLTLVAIAAGLERIVLIGGFPAALGSAYREVLAETMEEACDYQLLGVPWRGRLVLKRQAGDASLIGTSLFGHAMLAGRA